MKPFAKFLNRDNCFYTAFISLVCISCSTTYSKLNENDERADIDSETIIIDIDKCRKSDVRLENIITDVEYLCLENDGQHVLTVLQNIKKADSLIYIIDDNEHLYCFNDKGKFVRDVAVQGKAKNEVMKLYDFEIDDKYVYLLDGMRSAILTFRHNGSFVSSKQLPFRAIRFKKQDETHWLFQLSPYTLDNKQECFQVATTDSKFKIISSKIAYNDGEIVSTRTPYFENRNNALFYAPLYRRGVYRLTDKYDWKLAYYFEFHTPYFETADMAEGQMKAAQDGGYYNYQNPLHTDRYLIQHFESSKTFRGTMFVDLHSNKAMFAERIATDSNNLLNFSFENTKYYDVKEKKFYAFTDYYSEGIHSPEEIKKATAHLDDATKKLLVRTKESGEPNAVILMYRIKDGDIIK